MNKKTKRIFTAKQVAEYVEKTFTTKQDEGGFIIRAIVASVEIMNTIEPLWIVMYYYETTHEGEKSSTNVTYAVCVQQFGYTFEDIHLCLLVGQKLPFQIDLRIKEEQDYIQAQDIYKTHDLMCQQEI